MLLSIAEQEPVPPRVVGTPWTKGAPSPNPSGRPKDTDEEREAKAFFKSKTRWAAERAFEVAQNLDGKWPPELSWRATEHILDRGLGRVMPRDVPAENAGMTFNVVQMVCEPVPTPGVLAAPDPRWCAPQRALAERVRHEPDCRHLPAA
jgi:hypothetical protein